MPSKYDPTREEIEANTDRVRTLTREGKTDEATELTAATNILIDSVPKAERTRRRNELKSAGEPPTEVSTVPLPEVSDYTKIEGLPQLAEAAGQAMSQGVRATMEGTAFAREMARHLLDMRLSVTSRKNVPDLLSRTQAAKDAASAAYSIAGSLYAESNPDVPRKDVEDAVDSLMRSVQFQMSDILVTFLRSLDDDRETAERHFPSALERFPDLSPTEAVYAEYERVSQPLPRVSEIEKRRLRRQLERARKDGDEARTAELESALGGGSGSAPGDPEETLSTDMTRLHRILAATADRVDVLESASDETKRRVREIAEESVDLAKKILPHTL
ncbi:hypothetical protein [Streptomyces sp. NPDC007063]|uniref:hypothetical protein n=1 Tax=Streptomyces sp. NPDC007063 TaxID=3364772 RepID=UPI00369296CF